MSENSKIGCMNFRLRLEISIKDGILLPLKSPDNLASMQGIPKAELGVIADLSDDQRQSLISVVQSLLDLGIHRFLYGLDNQPDGFELSYNGELLNKEGLLQLSHPDED